MKKTAVVTGASRGIGAAIVRALAADGCQVAGIYRRPSAVAEALCRETGMDPILWDLADSARLPALAQRLTDQLGHVDILVNNAACSYTGLFQAMPPEQLRELYGVNLTAVIELTRCLLPGMLSRHQGCIINLASIWGETGASCEVDYAVTKGAVLAFTRALAKETAPAGIRVNAVSPGTIATDMTASLGSETLAALAEEIPMGRLGTPEEIGAAVRFLASDQAAYITGQDLPVNGGWFCG